MEHQLLDKIFESLSEDARRYFFPGIVREKEVNKIQNSHLDINPTGADDGVLFSIRPAENAELRFRTSTGDGKEGEKSSIILKEEELKSRAHFSVIGSKASDNKDTDEIFIPDIRSFKEEREECQKVDKVKKDSPSRFNSLLNKGKKAVRSVIPEPKPIEPDLDLKTKAFLEELEALKRKYGITIEEFEAVLSFNVKLSHLRITRHRAIILDDFDHQEVKMDTLTKAVFLLFLKHPEGIRYKDLCDHRRELESIYLSISGRSNLESMRKSISDLTDSVTSNSINEKVSKAKKAFRDVVDERIAKFYYIDGKQGAAKSIALDRSLVIWE